MRLFRAFGQIILGLAIFGAFAYGIETFDDGGQKAETVLPFVLLGLMGGLPALSFLVLGWFQLVNNPRTRGGTALASAIIAGVSLMAGLVGVATRAGGAPSGWLLGSIVALVTTIVLVFMWKGPGMETASKPVTAAAPAQPFQAERMFQIIAALGFVAVFVALFLPWYGSSGQSSSSMGDSFSAALTVNGFESAPWGILALIGAAAGLGLSFLTSTRKISFIPFAVAALFTLPVLFQQRASYSASAEFGDMSASASASAGPMVGAYIALGAAVVAAAACLIVTMKGRQAAPTG
jgi:hypothetical protein